MNLAAKLSDVAVIECLIGEGGVSCEEIGFNGRTPFLNACSARNTLGSSFNKTREGQNCQLVQSLILTFYCARKYRTEKTFYWKLDKKKIRVWWLIFLRKLD